MGIPAEKLKGRVKQDLFFQTVKSQKLLYLFILGFRIHDETDICMSGIEFPDDFVSCQLAVKKAECPIVLIRKGMDRLTQGIILGKTAVCSNPKTAGVQVLPECLAELLCMFKEIPAHIEKQTSGFRRDDPCFSAGKDRDPVFFFCLTENFTQVRLGHRQPLCGRR